MAGWFGKAGGGSTTDAADPRLPLGVFHTCPACGQRVIPAWEERCAGCQGRAAAVAPATPTTAPPPPLPFTPPPPPLAPPATAGAAPRPTAFHRLDADLTATPPAHEPYRPPQAPAAPKKTVKLDLRSAGSPAASTPAPPASPPRHAPPPPPVHATVAPMSPLSAPPPAPASGPKKTQVVSLPPRTQAAPSGAFSLAWQPPPDGESEGWTLQGASADGEPVVLHLRWNGEAWMLLDATGSPAAPALLQGLGLTARTGA